MTTCGPSWSPERGAAFCVGADFGGGVSPFDAPVDAGTFSASPITPAAFELRKPVIAAVNGHAIGIGLTIALQADIRIVAEEAKCGVVQVRRGVLPDCMAHWTLTQLTTLGVAADILLTGRTFGGADAAEGVAAFLGHRAPGLHRAAVSRVDAASRAGGLV